MIIGLNSETLFKKERFEFELGNKRGQKEDALQVGTIIIPLRHSDLLIFRSVGIIFETGGQSQRFSFSHECAKASTPKVFGQRKSEKNLEVFAFDESANGSRVKGPN